MYNSYKCRLCRFYIKFEILAKELYCLQTRMVCEYGFLIELRNLYLLFSRIIKDKNQQMVVSNKTNIRNLNKLG